MFTILRRYGVYGILTSIASYKSADVSFIGEQNAFGSDELHRNEDIFPIQEDIIVEEDVDELESSQGSQDIQDSVFQESQDIQDSVFQGSQISQEVSPFLGQVFQDSQAIPSLRTQDISRTVMSKRSDKNRVIIQKVYDTFRSESDLTQNASLAEIESDLTQNVSLAETESHIAAALAGDLSA
jgi:hypothetical protein